MDEIDVTCNDGQNAFSGLGLDKGHRNQNSEILRGEKSFGQKEMKSSGTQTDSWEDQHLFEMVSHSLIERFPNIGQIRINPKDYMQLFFDFINYEEQLKASI